MNNAVYTIITDRIVSMLEQGTCPWRRPWNRLTAYPQNYVSRRSYHGLNFLILAMIGYELPYFLTYNQTHEMGGNVKKGEKGMPIVFWQLLKSKDQKDAKGEPKKIPLLRYYTVFNASQVEGIEFPKVESRTGTEFNPIAEAERIVSNWRQGPTIEHGFSRACYSSTSDRIQMPSPGSFDNPQAYYATLFHEMGHATGHASRLARKLGNRFGSEDYSREELIAEMTAAFLCAHCSIDNTTEQSAAYLASWVKALKGDPKLVVQAASAAQKAANLILGIGEMDTEEEAEQPQAEEVAA